MINKENLIAFLGTETYRAIGKDRYGHETTVMVEFSEIFRECAKYVAMLAENYSFSTHKEAVLDADDYIRLQERMERKLYFITKKALWLNLCCKNVTNRMFLERPVNMNSVSDCSKFVKEFYTVIKEFLDEHGEFIVRKVEN